MDEYGPFATIATVALALVALFSMLVVKMLGSVKRWTWLTDDPPSFLVTAGPRAVAVAVMAAAYLAARPGREGWYVAGAVACGFLCLVAIAAFDRQRRVHVLGIPLVGPDGQALTDGAGRPQTRNVVIGTEAELTAPARRDYDAARARGGGLSLARFMSGYGHGQVNDPEALWDRAVLARIANRLTLLLMAIVLLAVLTLFLAALAVDISQRT